MELRQVAETVLAAAAVYGMALIIQSCNEFFDTSSPAIDEAFVVKKFTRYNPIPISVISVRNTEGTEYNVDVLDDVAAKLARGASIRVIRKRGFLGKEWVEDEDFYEYLNGTRMFQGYFNVAIGGIIGVCWYFLAKRRLHSTLAAMASLLSAGAIAVGVYWFLL